jgi:hypothetical protein
MAKRKTFSGNARMCSMLLTNVTRSASYETLPNHRPFPAKSEARRLIERLDDPSDRRGHRLNLTNAIRKALARIGGLTRELENDICSSRSNAERETLTSFLARIVAEQNITPAVHLAYRKLREGLDKPEVALRQPVVTGKP